MLNIDQVITELITLIANRDWKQIHKEYDVLCAIYDCTNKTYTCCNLCRKCLSGAWSGGRILKPKCPIRQLTNTTLRTRMTEDGIAELIIGLLKFKAEFSVRNYQAC